ncbi:MAG: hypothetical protein R8J94_01560 [Acidimicrobiia bacterium]|nr:hypothetical protein [Acidimicrobiia bacterium]
MTAADQHDFDPRARFKNTPVVDDLETGAQAAQKAARRRKTVQRSAAVGVATLLLIAGFFVGPSLGRDDATEIRTAEPDGQVEPSPTSIDDLAPPSSDPSTDDNEPGDVEPAGGGTSVATIDVNGVVRINDEVVDAETWLPILEAAAADSSIGPDGNVLHTRVGTGSGDGCSIHTILDAAGQQVADHPLSALSRCLPGELAGWSSAGHVVLVRPTEQDAWSITVLAADGRSAQLTSPGAFQPQQLDVHTNGNGRTQALVLGTGEEMVFVDVDAFLTELVPEITVLGISNETNLLSAQLIDGDLEHPYQSIIDGWVEDHVVDGKSTDEPSSLVWAVNNVQADDTLNARSGPGVEFDVVFEFGPNATGVVRSGNDATSTDGATWFEVFSPTSGVENDVGWVNSAFLIEASVSDTRPCLFDGPQDHYIGIDWTNPEGSASSEAAVISNIDTYRFGGCLRTVIEFSDAWSYEDGGAQRVTTLPDDIVVTRDNPPTIDFGSSITGAEVADARFSERPGVAQSTFVSMGADRQLDGVIYYGPTTTMWATFDNSNGTLIIDVADIRLPTNADATLFDRVGPAVGPLVDDNGLVLSSVARSADGDQWTVTGLARPFEANLALGVRHTDGTPIAVDWLNAVVDGQRPDNGVMTTTWTEAWGQFEFTIIVPDDVEPGDVVIVFDPSGGAADDPETIDLPLADFLS